LYSILRFQTFFSAFFLIKKPDNLLKKALLLLIFPKKEKLSILLRNFLGVNVGNLV